MNLYAERVIAEMMERWPIRREERYKERIVRHQAFRESDHDMLRPDWWSKDHEGVRDYVVDPLGERIPYIWSDLLFGQDPVIAPAATGDKQRMIELVDFNNLPSELQRAEWLCSSEGEVWWRIAPDPSTGHADLTWCSRLDVTPLWIGKRLAAAAFVSVLDRPDDNTIWRYVEIHTAKMVTRKLFKGTPKNDKLGEEMPMESRPETKDWESEWSHGLDMLAGRIPNKVGKSIHCGTSDFDGIEDLLLALNEITSIGQENARLTAKQRAIIPQRFLNMAGNFPRGAEILVATEVDQDPDKIRNEVAMVEFEFDAKALIDYTEHLTDRILTRARVAPQLVGRHTEGAQTGPALKARLVDSELAAQGKGKWWDDDAPKILRLCIQVENLPGERGGLGVKWSKTQDLPSFKRASALPEDPESLTRRLAVAVNAEMLSRKTAIQLSFPEWDEGRVEDEVKQIDKETGAGAEPPTTPTPGGPVPASGLTGPAERQERRDGPNGNH